ncbi:uncharacterized protein LOC144552546 [Carex rostrata]
MSTQTPIMKKAQKRKANGKGTRSGIEGVRFASLENDFWPADKITNTENDLLQLPFSLDEIKQALFDSEPHGAPGPDGFSFSFYQCFWELVKDDLRTLCQQFYQNSLILDLLNKSIICLIPKDKDATHISKYRPISLVNCSFKLISKILTNRLTHIMNRIIDDSQSAFLPNRYILNNVVLGQEIIHYSQQFKQQGAITNCYYADDTILFLEAKHEIVEAAWWAMLAFEAASGIKINLDKIEMKLSCRDWLFLVDKIAKRLSNWKDIDKIRCRFLWQGSDKQTKKYALIKWPIVCLDKEYGGLGILDLEYMNMALLVKWWWKFKDPTFTNVINTQGSCIHFRQTLTGVDKSEWAQILHMISTISFTHSQDRISWRWDTTGRFTVKSLYRFLTFWGIGIELPMI